MGLLSKCKSIMKVAATLYRLRKDLDYVLMELDDMNSAIIAIERDLELVPEVFKSLSNDCSALTTKLTSMEAVLVDKEVITSNYSKRILN